MAIEDWKVKHLKQLFTHSHHHPEASTKPVNLGSLTGQRQATAVCSEDSELTSAYLLINIFDPNKNG